MSFKIRCEGGPKHGKVYTWVGTFPKSIVFQDAQKGIKHEYFHKPNSSIYEYKDKDK